MSQQSITTVGLDSHAQQEGIAPDNRIRINDTDYDVNTLPEEARQLIVQIRVADQEISRNQRLTAILHDARQHYGARLSALLPKA